MRGPNDAENKAFSHDLLDGLAIAYLTLPLAIFLAGWFEPWIGLPLIACLAYALWNGTRESARRRDGRRAPVVGAAPAARATGCGALELAVALGIGLLWALCGGTGHWLFANPDWQVRDAVLHDLVVGAWPVGYGPLDGHATLLRAPLAYYLPAALFGKLLGLPAAHVAMAAWTGLGATLFLLQVLSLAPPRLGAALAAAAVIVLFSGLDLIGNFASVPDFAHRVHFGSHLEWWAGRYQYSSMTTQLFWVPNHALGGWLAVGLLARERTASALDALWPLLLVAVALWSPLTAVGLVPFVLWRLAGPAWRVRLHALLSVRTLVPALLLGVAVASYLALDAARIPKGFTFGREGFDAAALARDFARQLEFFLLEAGLIGVLVLTLRRSGELVLALVILAFLPLASFGAANDLVMRASIPSLAVLAIGAALALVRPWRAARTTGRRVALAALLLVGAVTPLEEFARATILPAWPIDLEARLIEAACGRYPANYVARLSAPFAAHLLRPPQVLAPAQSDPASCRNPAARAMRERGLW